MKRSRGTERPVVAAFAVGDRVYLKGCPFGEPGRVLRMECGKVAVLWPSLGPTYISRHSPGSLRATHLGGRPGVMERIPES